MIPFWDKVCSLRLLLGLPDHLIPKGFLFTYVELFVFMKTHVLNNNNLGLSLHFWNGERKPERVFLSSEVMKQLGYKGGVATLRNADLEDGADMIKIRKINHPEFIQQLSDFNLIGLRTASVVMLYESGVWKLIMKSRKPIGIKTRNWLAREVLPSIRRTGKYNVMESEMNPFSYLHDFTEQKKQLENSKAVAAKAKSSRISYSDAYNAIHKLVTGKTAKEIKVMFKSKESARELLRKNFPEFACTEAVIDEIWTNYNITLEQIEKSNAHRTLPPAFKSLYDLGVNFISQ